MRAARPRRLLALEHQHPGALAEHEAVAAAVEGPRGGRRRVVVVRRHHPHPREAVDHARRHAGVDAAREQRVVLAVAQQRQRVADRVGGARAAGREHVADAVQPQRDRDLARHHADDRHGDGVGRDLLQAVGEELAVLPLADLDAAGAAADDDAGARLAEAQAGVDPGLARGDDAGQRRPRIAARIGVIGAGARRRRRRSTAHRRSRSAAAPPPPGSRTPRRRTRRWCACR